MYLNFSIFRGRTSAGGWTSLGPKMGTSVGWGGLTIFLPDGQSPQEKNPLMWTYITHILGCRAVKQAATIMCADHIE